MKWSYFILSLAVFSHAARGATTTRPTLSPNLIGTSVDQVGSPVSPTLNETRFETRQLHENTTSQIEQILNLLSKNTEKLNLVGTAVNQACIAISSTLSEIRSDIRQLYENTNSQNGQILTLLTKNTEEVDKLIKQADGDPCERPVMYSAMTKIPRSGIPDKNKDYAIVDFIANFYGAQNVCEIYGLKLATVEDDATFNYLSPFLTDFMNSLDLEKTRGGFFLAGTDIKTPGSWYWKWNKTPIMSNHWGQGEPSGADEHCLELKPTGGNSSFSFVSTNCKVERRAICEHTCIFTPH